jgi:hypothetical protein
MAKRLNPQHDERTRLKIKTSQLVNRLNSFALGEKSQGKLVDMSTQQVNAAKILLAKVLPDLKSTEFKGNLSLTKDPSEMTDEELAAIAANSGATPPST